MKRNEEYNWFKLLNAAGFGLKSIHYLYSRMNELRLAIEDVFSLTEKEFYESFPELGIGKFSKANYITLQNSDNDKVYESFQKLKDQDVHIVGLGDSRYPKRVLDNMGTNAPVVLFCKGYLQLLNTPGISIVGSRDVDDFSIMLTKSIAANLAGHGFNVTSGYAKGVDTNAHLGALENGGTTTMILSFGVNYISIKKELKEFEWERNSLFITQFQPFEKFSGQNAMMRNKLVCAMSKAIVVMTSGPERDSEGKMSGTFDAGKSALNMGIPVFVLSPTILKPTPQGNVDLIKLGGKEFKNGSEIVEYLESHSEASVIQPKMTTKSNQKIVGLNKTADTQLGLF
jgi:DNA processing protein